MDTNDFEVEFAFIVKYSTNDFKGATINECMTELHERLGEHLGTKHSVLSEFVDNVAGICGYSVHLYKWNSDDDIAMYSFQTGEMGEPAEIRLRGLWWPNLEVDEPELHPFVAQTCNGREFNGAFLVRDSQVYRLPF